MNDYYLYEAADAVLFAAARRGDGAAIEALLARYGSFLQQTLSAMLARSSEPADIWLRLLSLPQDDLVEGSLAKTITRLCATR